MRVLVPVKQTLDPRGITVRRDKERVFVNREEYILEAGSKAAVEAAARLKDGTGAEVFALTVGSPRADDALREALAMGCDAAYLLSDAAFENLDVTATVRILAAAVRKVGGADLILVGRESADTGAGQVGPRLAQALGMAQVTDVHALEVHGTRLDVIRRWADSFSAVGVSLPAVVSVAPEAFPPRCAHGARIMSAYREWQVTVWNAADLDLDEAALAPILAFRGESFPPALQVGEAFRGEADRVAQEVVSALRLSHLIP